MMRRATKRRVRLFLRLLFLGTLTGVVYQISLALVFFSGFIVPRILVGVIGGASMTAPIAAMELFLLRSSRWGRHLKEAPFLVMFGVKWLVYGLVITAVVAGQPGARVAGLKPGAPLQTPTARLSVLFSFAAALAFLLIFEISQIVGARNLRNIVLGRYHRPRIEERFFLFVDIAGSTSLAERLGPVAVHRFLGNVFRLASDPVGDYRGEIYQYVGDELVATWTVADARTDARPIACFFAIVAALEDATPEFEREFGVAPRLRAALHAGRVICGEVGEIKRDIVFHGDVMNTAARLEQATRDLDRGFLASADALSRLAGVEQYTLEPLGPQRLRGRAAPIDVYAVGAGIGAARAAGSASPLLTGK